MNPAPATVLDVWEAGLPRTPAARAVLLLEAAGERDAGAWPVGRGQLALLAAWCGTDHGLEVLADCPGCGAVLDLAVDPALLASAGGAAGGTAGETSDGTAGGGPVTVTDGDYAVTAHPPTVGDLAALSPGDDAETRRRQLLARCVTEATLAGEPVPPGSLPERLVDLVEAALEEADPAADIRLALACPECAATWSESLDPLELTWSSVERAARRLAVDVHRLARAYGWSEPEILALSPFRRQLYLSAIEP